MNNSFKRGFEKTAIFGSLVGTGFGAAKWAVTNPMKALTGAFVGSEALSVGKKAAKAAGKPAGGMIQAPRIPGT